MLEPVIFLTLAVMRETALGSGRVLGMLLQSCHMKLGRKIKIYKQSWKVSSDYKDRLQVVKCIK